jgi:outer membrane protein
MALAVRTRAGALVAMVWALTLALPVLARTPVKLPHVDLPAIETPTDVPPQLRIVKLVDVERLARDNQPQLRVSRAATEAAKARVAQVHTGYLPQVTGLLQYQRLTGNFAPRPGTLVPATSTVTMVPNFDFFNASIQASQLVYDFGQIANRQAAAEAAEDALQWNEKTAELQVVAGARRAYFQARAQKALLDVARETLANQRRHLKQIAGFVQAGTRPEIDLVQGRTNVSNAEVGVITAQNAYDTGRALLNQAIGQMGEMDYDVGDEEQLPLAGEDASQQVLLEKAIGNRPELLALDKQRRQQELTLKAIHNTLWPSLAVNAGVTEVGVSLGGLVPNWNIGASLNWPIFQGGLVKAQEAEANANLAAVDGQNGLQLLQIQSDVSQARLAVRAAKATIVAADDALGNAKELLRLAEARYFAGVGNGIELNDTQLALTNAAVQVIAARYNLSTARAQLLAALGQP